MAGTASSSPALSVHITADGTHHVGFDADGTFVPFASVSANRIEQLQERAANLKALAAEDNASATARHDEAANALPYTTEPAKAEKASA